MTEAGRGSGCPALRWAGLGAGFRPSPPASGGVEGPTNPVPKMGTFLVMMMMDVMAMQVSPLSGTPGYEQHKNILID